MAKHNFPPMSATMAQAKKFETCNICNASVDSEVFRDHLIEHEMKNGIVSCVICTSIFTSIVGLREHIREHSLTPSDLKEACDKCSSRFLYKSELLHHRVDHDNDTPPTSKPIKTEVENGKLISEKMIKEEEDDDYIEIEKVADNS